VSLLDRKAVSPPSSNDVIKLVTSSRFIGLPLRLLEGILAILETMAFRAARYSGDCGTPSHSYLRFDTLTSLVLR